MEEEQLDVQVDPSTTDESSNDGQETAQPETQEVVETPKVESVPEVRQPLVEEVDEMGVPLKNRLAEAQRKLQQREKELEEARSAKQQQAEEPKYTAEQLRAFAASTEDQQSRIWALQELDKVSKLEMEAAIAKKFEEVTQKSTEGQIRQQTLQGVIQRNPDVIVKDASGQILGFNTEHPLYKRIDFYMKNPKLVADPQGLEVAEALAMRDLNFAQKPIVQNTIKKQANQIKSLQKNTMVEGGGSNSNVAVSARQAAIEKARQTGKVSDAAQAMGQILRDGGIMSD